MDPLLFSSHFLSRHSHRHVTDPFVKAARHENLRSRGAYKLKEIQDKYRILRPGHRVLDLGAAPGGWSEVAAAVVIGENGGRVVAVDLKDMAPLKGVTFMLGDFTEPGIQSQLLTEVASATITITTSGKSSDGRGRGRGSSAVVDVLLSDMAPDFTGDKETDHLRSMDLCSKVLDFAAQHLRPSAGTVLCKFFRGRDDRSFVARARADYHDVLLVKPKASRQESSEMYLLARRLKQRMKETVQQEKGDDESEGGGSGAGPVSR